MGSSCSQPAAAVQPTQEILVLVEQINMVSGHSNVEMRFLKRTLARNSSMLKKRIQIYAEKLKDADEANPATAIWRAEKERSEQLLKTVIRMQIPLNYMS